MALQDALHYMKWLYEAFYTARSSSTLYKVFCTARSHGALLSR